MDSWPPYYGHNVPSYPFSKMRRSAIVKNLLALIVHEVHRRLAILVHPDPYPVG